MHKIRRRALIAVALVLILCAGLAWYIALYIRDGGMWVSLPSNRHLYQNGELILGTVTDRDGVVLAETVDGMREYAEDETVRRAMLHIVGDTQGKIGTGAQTKFSGELSGFSPVSGLFFAGKNDSELKLTVDADISRAAYEALGDYNGAVIAYNYKTGALLCAVSKPGYDPENVPADIETNAAYSGAYLNRCFGAAYTPGSTMKVVTAAAAIETVPELFDLTFTCSGSTVVGGQKINCMNTHGTIGLETALAKSCNVAFADLSLLVGGETLSKYFHQFGLDTAFEIDGIRVTPGSFTAYEDGTAELAWSGIGQSTDLVSPAAMMRLMGAIANDGVAVTPRLQSDTKSSSERLMSAETAQTLTRLMRHAVATVYGDGSFPPALAGKVCAKSGTAQLDDAASHSWFVGFVDDENCPCAFAVVAENAGAGSGVAKTVAAAVLRAVVSD
ncbi:MAG: penicillin-binding protein [Clostridiales bacterium]|nr:penicillin-binding protein [Clostridiales bacterium]